MSEDLSPQLYAVYLGGDPSPGRLSEDHEVVFVVAPDIRAARRSAREKWAGHSRPHVDAVMEIGVIDGYRVVLEPSNEADSLAIDATYEPEEELPVP